MNAAAPRRPVTAGEWWQLPSGKTVSVRDVNTAGTEATVRYVDEHGSMAEGSFSLRVAFILRGRKVVARG